MLPLVPLTHTLLFVLKSRSPIAFAEEGNGTVAAGYAITKIDLDNTMGRLVVNLRDAFIAAVSFKASLDDTTILPDATLTTLGYSAGEIAQIRASFSAINSLYNISKAAATQPAVNDFWFDAKHLTGLNFH